MSDPITLEDSAIKIGETIQLQFPEYNNFKCFVNMVGYVRNKGVITTPPLFKGELVKVTPGLTIAVKYFVNRGVYSFTTKAIDEVFATPFEHLFMEYPGNLDFMEVRKSERIKVNIVSIVRMEGHEKPTTTMIKDLSEGGALLLSKEEIPTSKDLVTINFTIALDKERHVLTIPSSIRSRKTLPEPDESGFLYQYGVSFNELTKMDSLVLNNFHYRQQNL